MYWRMRGGRRFGSTDQNGPYEKALNRIKYVQYVSLYIDYIFINHYADRHIENEL